MKLSASNIFALLCLLFLYPALAQPSGSDGDSPIDAKFLIAEIARLCTPSHCCANKRTASSMVAVLRYLVSEGKIKSTAALDVFLNAATENLAKCSDTDGAFGRTRITFGGVEIYSKPATKEEKIRALQSWSQEFLADGAVPEVMSIEDALVLKEVEKTFPKLDSSFKQNPAPALKLLAEEPGKFLHQYGNPAAGETLQDPSLILKELQNWQELDRPQAAEAGGGSGSGSGRPIR